MRGKHDVQHSNKEQCLPALQPEKNSRYLTRRQIDGGHDHAIEQKSQIHGAKAPDNAGCLTRVADFVKFKVRHYSGAPPEPGVEKNGRDAGKNKRPPNPVAGDALSTHNIRDQIRGVTAECRRYHGQTCKPPRNGAARCEKFGGILAGALAEEECRGETNDQRPSYDDPIKKLDVNGLSLYNIEHSGRFVCEVPELIDQLKDTFLDNQV
jgi:hypothetical protein